MIESQLVLTLRGVHGERERLDGANGLGCV
jgi:hypothetical protein